MNITFIGVGAIGTLWATQLVQAGHRVQVITRAGTEVCRQLVLDSHTVTVPANQPQAITDCDLLMVCTKAYDVMPALQPLIEQLHPDTIIVLMHNGMGPHAQIKTLVSPSQPLLLATTSHGVFSPSQGSYQHTGHGETYIGAANQAGQQCAFVAEVLDHALSPVYWHEAIIHQLWHKLAVNCVINPLTAIHQVNNGALLSADYQDTIQLLCQELARVMQADGLATHAEQLKTQALTVARATANNYSSMNRDCYHGRKTELEQITGYLLARAAHHQIKVPTHQALYDAVKQREVQKG